MKRWKKYAKPITEEDKKKYKEWWELFVLWAFGKISDEEYFKLLRENDISR